MSIPIAVKKMARLKFTNLSPDLLGSRPIQQPPTTSHVHAPFPALFAVVNGTQIFFLYAPEHYIKSEEVVFSKVYFLKVCSLKCIFTSCIFPKCIFPKCIYPKCIFLCNISAVGVISHKICSHEIF